MSLWDRIRGYGPSGYRAQRARKLAQGGDIAAAIDAFLGARQPDEAARLWLLRADAENTLSKRILFFEHAASAALDPELKRQARARKARLAFDLIRDKGSVVKSEICVVAADLMAAGEHLTAAEAFAIVGDTDGEIRALTAAGAIDRLEERLSGDAERSRETTQLNATLLRLKDLDRGGERRSALALARELGSSDRRVEDLVRTMRQRLVRGPLCELSLDGAAITLALGDEVTIGRGDAAIVVESRALSRNHLRLYRAADGSLLAEDMGTRNGTSLGGAKLGGPVPIGERLLLLLGGEVECSLSWQGGDGPLMIAVAGGSYLAPLGRFAFGAADRAAHIRLDGKGGDDLSFVVLETGESPMYREGLQLGPAVELAIGDQIGFQRSGEPAVIVGRSPAQ